MLLNIVPSLEPGVCAASVRRFNQDGPGPPSRSLAAAAAAPLLLALVLFREVLVDGRVFFQRDVHLMWYGQLVSLARALREGALPLWEPFASFGTVMLANANYQVLYPPTWLALLLRPADVISLYVVAHFLFAGIGCHRLARELGLGRDGAVLASAVWLVSSAFLSSISLWNHFGGLSWAPWVLLAALRLAARPGLRPALWLAVATALQLFAGSPDLTLFTLVLAALALASGGAPGRLKWYALAQALAAGLAAVQWVPSLAAAHASGRGATVAATAAMGSLHPAGGLLKLMLPFGAWDLPLRPEHQPLFIDGGRPLLGSIYVGAATAGLVVAGALRRRPWRSALVAVALASFALAMGPHTPVWPALATILPPLRWLRYPEKAALVAGLAGALLSGMGWEAWREREAPRLARLASTAGPSRARGGGGGARARARPAGRVAPAVAPAGERRAVGRGARRARLEGARVGGDRRPRGSHRDRRARS